MRKLSVTVRAVEEQDIEQIEMVFDEGNPNKHRERFAMQERGEGLYLVAWQDNQPVGHLFLKWDGTSEESVQAIIDDCPDIEDIFVLKDYRMHGIGHELLKTVERSAREKGCRQIGLAVGLTNHTARELYQHEGFIKSTIAPYTISWNYIAGNGTEKTETTICEYFVKQLI